uniref:Sic1.270 n=1 Tax=Streptococcus pyogenes TaxID=1314 RepID=Q9JNC9_STRPY|nr:Sic1.270 [Streptococcus pyogenes]
MNIRNKIERK